MASVPRSPVDYISLPSVAAHTTYSQRVLVSTSSRKRHAESNFPEDGEVMSKRRDNHQSLQAVKITDEPCGHADQDPDLEAHFSAMAQLASRGG